jgi:4-diphosphocytidyl-2-C-methyl-D-erythritol kinase
MPLVELARAKVNLALHVLGRRSDGYHELDSLVAFATVADKLTFERGGRLSFEVTGPFAASVPRDESNLVVKAAAALSDLYPGRLGSFRIRLEKNLPVAAGLGGGSADAAAVLRALARLSEIDVGDPGISAAAFKLGADVPVCLVSRASRMSGGGEIVEPLEDFIPRDALLIHPGRALPTGDVFRALEMSHGAKAFPPIPDGMDFATGRNDLTAPATKLAPVIAEVLTELERQPGLELARMSGSGAACFGLFKSGDDTQAAADRIGARHPDWWCRATRLD